MRLPKIILYLLFLPIIANGQITSDWINLTNKIKLQLEDSIIFKTEPTTAYDSIIYKRSDLIKRIDTTQADFIILSEYFNTKSNEYDFCEDYYYLKDSIWLWRTRIGFDKEWNKWELTEHDIQNIHWDYSCIDSLKPRNYLYQGGCTITKWKTLKIKMWEHKIKRKGKVIEDYYIIDSFIDKLNDSIKISFRFPVASERKLEASFGPTGYTRKPILKMWYWK